MERYEVKSVESPVLIAEVDRLWGRLRTDPELIQDAQEAGIDVLVFADTRRNEVLGFRTTRHGIGGPELLDAAVISVTSGLHVIAWDLWKKVLLPRLVRRFGKDAVKPVPAAPTPPDMTNETKSAQDRVKKSTTRTASRGSSRRTSGKTK